MFLCSVLLKYYDSALTVSDQIPTVHLFCNNNANRVSIYILLLAQMIAIPSPVVIHATLYMWSCPELEHGCIGAIMYAS